MFNNNFQTDILIIGGGPAGIVCAVTARKNNHSKKIVVVRDTPKTVVPCGIPYIFHRLNLVDEDIIPDDVFVKNNIKLIIDKAIKLDSKTKKVFFQSGREIIYDKLVLATGSSPVHIPIPGVDKEGVWFVKKDYTYLKKLRQAVLRSKNIVIIGGGFIGVELADELSNIKNLNISIVEMEERCLSKSFDKEFSQIAEEKLKQNGVKIYTGTKVLEIKGQDRVESVKTEGGKDIPADLVILSIGARPNISLAKDSKMRIGEYKGFWVDEYMRTNIEDIFAIGDCAETRDFITSRHLPVMLSSIATSEARIAGANLYQMRLFRKNKGTLGSFSTEIKGTVLAATGVNEERAKKEGIEVVTGYSESYNHHPQTLPRSELIKLKLIFFKSSGTILGAELAGPESVSEMINILALAIQEGLTISDFDTFQISTHPLLTAAPTVYPIIMAAQSALQKME